MLHRKLTPKIAGAGTPPARVASAKPLRRRPLLSALASASARACACVLRGAGRNLADVLHAPPQAVHLLLSLWPLAWGQGAMSERGLLWATAPGIYLWMHTGPFAFLSARSWGAGMVAIGAWQVIALVWPSPCRGARMLSAARCLCGCYSGLALGFFLTTPASPGWRLYAIFAAASVWCLWRLAPRRAGDTGCQGSDQGSDQGSEGRGSEGQTPGETTALGV